MMKQSLLALSAMAVVGVASAQSSVTLYGRIDEGFKGTHTETNAPSLGTEKTKDANAINANNTTTSRFGIKAKEDLGGGTSANAVLEFGLNPHDANTAFATRQAYIALQNQQYGTLAVGRQQTSTYHALIMQDESRGAPVPGSIFYNRLGIYDRGNVVSYSLSNDYITLGGAYLADNASHTDSIGGGSRGTHAYELSATGHYRGLNILGAYIKGSDAMQHDAVSSATSADALTLGANYDFSFANVGYTYHRYSGNGIKIANLPVSGNLGFHQIGATLPITPAIDVYGSYFLASGNASVYGADVDVDGSGYQLGARYKLSKRTQIYGLYGEQTLAGTYKKTANTLKDSAYTVGLRHEF